MTRDEAIDVLKAGGVIKHPDMPKKGDYIAGVIEIKDGSMSHYYYDEHSEMIYNVYPVCMDDYPADGWAMVE